MKRRADIEKKLTKFLEPRVNFAFLYGSVLTDYFRTDSDVDVAIYFGERLRQTDVRLLKEELSEFFNDEYEFDLVSLYTADPIVAMQVLSKGKLIIANQAATLVEYKTRMISQYLDLRMSRRIIEDGIAEGSIYG